MKIPFTLVLALSLSSCVGVPVDGPVQSTAPGIEPDWALGQRTDAVLYARDGSPVGTARPGTVTTEESGLGHELEKTGGSRLVLLDLYQQAVDERDELLFEVDAQGRALEQAAQRFEDLARENTELKRAYGQIEADLRGMEDRVFELAGRLTTAQIRRLEAEKLLLESTIEWRQVNELNERSMESKGKDE